MQNYLFKLVTCYMHILGFIALHGIYYVVNFILFSLVNDDMESSKRCVIRFITCSLIMFFETRLYIDGRYALREGEL